MCGTAAVAALALAGAAAPTLPAWRYEAHPVAPEVTLLRPDPFRPPVEGNVTVIEQTDGLVVIDAWFVAPILASARKEAPGQPIVQGTG
jgi:hypothetical protein